MARSKVTPSLNGVSYELAEPFAPAMIESLRAFGYNLPAAIADLIDNSITAGARNVWLDFFWDGRDSYISVFDDGNGMTRKALVNAMRPGSRNPLETRDAEDLGRFGLGLKTASFSQCRRLTVRSKVEGDRASTRCWDLDYVNQSGEWRLLKTVGAVTEARLRDLASCPGGTIVLWEQMDRIVGDVDPADRREHEHFLELIDEVKAHLAMVFHRYLSGAKCLRIYVNGDTESHRIKPWDPFLESEAATQQLREERLAYGGAEILIRPFVLPHHDRLDQKTHRLAAGPGGWNDQQGFYIYRNRRLLVAGDWLGLGFAKEEHHKLARILVDIPNSLDGEWSIDVKKARARPPSLLRRSFRRIARLTRARAEEVYRHRGKYEARRLAGPHVFAWRTARRGSKVIYQVNREHPLVRRALDASEEVRPLLEALLRLLEETVPVQQIWIDAAREPEAQAQPFESVPEREVQAVMLQVFDALLRGGLDVESARQRISSMESFSAFPHLVSALGEMAG